jgi:hypothetical protein
LPILKAFDINNLAPGHKVKDGEPKGVDSPRSD